MAVTLPFNTQFNASYHNKPSLCGGKYDPQMLSFIGIAFKRIFGIRLCIGFAFPVINCSFFQYLPYFGLCDMPAIHPAASVMGIYQMVCMAINRISTIVKLLALNKKYGQKKKSYY